jgi:hypothetical protein
MVSASHSCVCGEDTALGYQMVVRAGDGLRHVLRDVIVPW